MCIRLNCFTLSSQFLWVGGTSPWLLRSMRRLFTLVGLSWWLIGLPEWIRTGNNTGEGGRNNELFIHCSCRGFCDWGSVTGVLWWGFCDGGSVTGVLWWGFCDGGSVTGVLCRDGSNTGQKYLNTNTNTARLYEYEYEYSENGKYSNTNTFKMYSWILFWILLLSCRNNKQNPWFLYVHPLSLL